MSITSRINEMSSHIEQAYDELQGLGADLTNVNKNIENISMVLDDIYDSMPQVSGEGTSLTLEDTRVGKIKSTLKGNTSQTGTPTPSSPIPVNVVSGDNEISICGKNLYNSNDTTYYEACTYVSGANTNQYKVKATGTDVIINLQISSGTSYSSVAGTLIPCKYGETIYYDTGNSNFGKNIVTQYNSNKVSLGFSALNIGSSSGSYTPTDSDCEYISIRIGYGSATSGTEYTLAPIFSKLSNLTYEPYQGNTYNIDLPEGIELCKIGNYQDYFYKDSGKWYLHKEIGKVVLDGSENISIYNQNTNRTNFQVDILTGIENYLGNYDVPNLLSNMFNVVSQSATWVVGNISRRREAQTTLYLTYEPSTTIDQFKTWLSTHNVNVYYIFATPTNTEITYQPLIDQLNLLEKAMSKNGQTNISQVNNDLPFIISASALKEWQENTSLNSTLSMVNPLSLGNTLNTQEIENDIQPIEVDNIEPLEEEENEES